MKKVFIFAVCLAFLGLTQAQLPDGSYAPNFSLFEIDRAGGDIITTDTFSLYEYTDAGKAVFLDFFTTWCGPCWTYHCHHHFESLYNTYGPDGTNEIMAFAIEGDAGNYASLSGNGCDANGSVTRGNWLDGVSYPVIPTCMSPNTHAIVDDYAITQFPTIYMVCPNRQAYLVGQSDSTALYNAINDRCNTCRLDLSDNARILDMTDIKGTYLCEASVTPSILLQNVGNQNLTSAVFSTVFDGETSTFTWTGNLGKFDATTVELPAIAADLDGIHTCAVSIVSVNGVPDTTDLSGNSVSRTFDVQVTGIPSIDEQFSNSSFLQNWQMDDDVLQLFTGHILFDGYNDDDVAVGELCLPLMDLTGYDAPALTFDVAYARYTENFQIFNAESLAVRVSKDCGSSWSEIYNRTGESLSTADPTVNEFSPSPEQWRTETVDLSQYATNQSIVKFVFTKNDDWGNRLWLDNVKIAEATGIDRHEADFGIYPNPATSILHVRCDGSVEKLEVYNLQGQIVDIAYGNVHDINVGNLVPGMYILRVSTSKGILNQRFTKE